MISRDFMDQIGQ